MPLTELRILPSYKLPDMKKSQSSAQEVNSTGTHIKKMLPKNTWWRRFTIDGNTLAPDSALLLYMLASV